MKKIIILLILILIVSFFQKEKEEGLEETRGVYISYIEISEYLQDKGENESKKNIDRMINNINELNLNTIILQVRPSLDAIYPSKIFPISKYLSSNNYYPYDVLSYFIEESHKKNIKIIAWINPYRVLTTGTKEDISKYSPAYQYRNTDIVYENNGVYLNPAREETNDLIKKGVEELLKYDIDGIMIDDYFYPSDDIDIIEYEEYKKQNPNIFLKEYHLETVNKLIKDIHTICHNKNRKFGIAPEGNIENNYNKNYADVKTWLNSRDYVDFIMPQIYYGFLNETKPFIETSNTWNTLITEEIDMIASLAFYKVGAIDEYAKSGRNEWKENNNMISREIIHLKSLSHYKGFVLYRYDYIFNEETFTGSSQKEIENLKKTINYSK